MNNLAAVHYSSRFDKLLYQALKIFFKTFFVDRFRNIFKNHADKQ